MAPTRERNCTGMEDEAGEAVTCALSLIDVDNTTRPDIDGRAVSIYAQTSATGEIHEIGERRSTAPDIRERNVASALCATVIRMGVCPLYELGRAENPSGVRPIVRRGNGNGKVELKIVH